MLPTRCIPELYRAPAKVNKSVIQLNFSRHQFKYLPVNVETLFGKNQVKNFPTTETINLVWSPNLLLGLHLSSLTSDKV